MKAISTTIYIVVAAVVILVAALVVLTIFGGGIQPVVDVTQARSICIQQASATCTTLGELPPTWWQETFNIKGNPKSCSDNDVAGDCSCENRVLKCTGLANK